MAIGYSRNGNVSKYTRKERWLPRVTPPFLPVPRVTKGCRNPGIPRETGIPLIFSSRQKLGLLFREQEELQEKQFYFLFTIRSHPYFDVHVR